MSSNVGKCQSLLVVLIMKLCVSFREPELRTFVEQCARGLPRLGPEGASMVSVRARQQDDALMMPV
jgi:hypothetical protein